MRQIAPKKPVVLAVMALFIATAPIQGQNPPKTLPVGPPQQSQQQESTGEAWRLIQPPQATVVVARDGSVLGEIGKEKRVNVSIRTLPKYVPLAFIAVEDKRFYQHDGVDLVGVAGAIKGKIMGERRGGASTITQQLVGNMHPDIIDRRDLSAMRKLREQAAAREMEKHYSKEQILEAYLNQISFGRGWFGIELAARHYFGKGAAQLSLAEAATLAAMPKSPLQYDPVRNADRAQQRRNVILGLMLEQGYITPAQAAEAKSEPVKTDPEFGKTIAPWVVDVVRVQAERGGVPVLTGGYRIVTTIDQTIQFSAQQALSNGIKEVETRAGFRGAVCSAPRAAGAAPIQPADCLEGATVVLDPSNGEVRALVGGREYSRSPFNRAVDGNRQPGSAFKAFVYATAITEGVTANSMVQDTALHIRMPNGVMYSPENSDKIFQGEITMREALMHSRNPVAVQLAMNAGMDSVIAMARRAGLRAPIAPYPSSALGASVVQPLDFVASYATFDNGGMAVDPHFISRIEDRAGKTVYSPPVTPPQAAMDPRVAFIMRDMLRDVVDRGTATAVRRVVPNRVPVAGKTGTTNDNTDVWFVGMTPELVMGVWLGFDKPRMIAPGAAGGTLAAPIAGQILADFYVGRPSSTWTPPMGVVSAELDRVTGKPADALTPSDRKYQEWFLDGTEPGAARTWPWRLFKNGPIVF